MKKAILLAAVVAVAGCADPHEPLSPDFGNAVQRNIAAQVVNPVPAASMQPDWYGDPASSSMDRYRAGKVYQPKLLTGDGKDYQQSPESGNNGSR